jgi:hypothetical protein
MGAVGVVVRPSEDLDFVLAGAALVAAGHSAFLCAGSLGVGASPTARDPLRLRAGRQFQLFCWCHRFDPSTVRY